MTDCNAVHSPTDLISKLISTGKHDNINRNVPYQEAIGSLLYLSQGARPDICFIVNKFSIFNNELEMQHWLAVKRVLRYIKGTKECKFIISQNKEEENVFGYSDSDWASDTNSRQSCTGYSFLLQGASVRNVRTQLYYQPWRQRRSQNCCVIFQLHLP